MTVRSWRISLLLLANLALAAAQTITTVAGTNWAFPTSPLPALQAPLGQVASVAADNAGNYYIADIQNFLVLKVDVSGTLSVVAGNGSYGYSGDNGPAAGASMRQPYAIAVDPLGNLYIADPYNYRVRKVDTNGIITTVAGNGTPGFSGDDGPATSASLDQPFGLAVDASGNLFISDVINQRVRKVTAAGIISTVAGNGVAAYSGDGGQAASSSLNSPKGLAVDSSGNLYIADENNNVIRSVTPGGVIRTVAGNGTAGFSGDNGPAASAELFMPRAVQVDSAGNLYIADDGNMRVRKVTAAGTITTIAGDGNTGFSGDGGPAVSAAFNNPRDLALDAFGDILIADLLNSRVRKVAAGGIVTTVAGNGGYRSSGDGGPATGAVLQYPSDVVADAAGNLFIVDAWNNRVRQVDAGGIISTVAGNGIAGYSGDNGPATGASLWNPFGAAVDASGNLFIADSDNSVIRKVTPGGAIATFAGNGAFDYSGDNGPAASAALDYPNGVAVDGSGNLFIADSVNNVVREVSAGGIITTVAGSGTPGYAGDEGPATSALLNYPAAVAVDSSGNLFIADMANNVIRKVAAGIITTVAGNGSGDCAYTGDNGPATGAELCQPNDVAVDASGNLLIADTGDNVIRKVDAGGIVTTVAGTGNYGFSGDNGPATGAALSNPEGVAVDSACNIFIADTYNNRIRKVAGLSVSPATAFLDATAQPGPPVSVTPVGPGCAWTTTPNVPWLAVNTGASGTGNGAVTFSAQANTGGAPRTGALNISGQTVSVTQRETARIFTDVAPPDYYFDFAGLMYTARITAGCSANPIQYCPDSTTTRAQMAVFLIAAIEGGNSFTYTTTPYFTDVPPASPYFKFVQKLTDLGITSGCSATQFCPDDAVTRGQMAVFIVKSRYGSIPFAYPATPYFTDVPAPNGFFPFVQKMAQARITAGCGPNLYCPDQALTRGQMAVFIVTGLLNDLLPAGTPYIATAAPGTAPPGQAVTVTLTGVNTHFAQGTTQVTAAPGIAVSNVTVASASSLTVQFALGAGMPPGPTSLVVNTGSEEAVLPNGFIVQ